MVLVRTDTGQLVMVTQQVLAQAQAKTQQGQAAVSNISPQPGIPTAGANIRVSTPSQVLYGEISIKLSGAGWNGFYHIKRLCLSEWCVSAM